MNGHSEAILFAVQPGVLLAAIASWLMASAYRRGMLALMRGGPAADAAHVATPAATAGTPPLPRTRPRDLLAANRNATSRAMLVLAGACLLIGLTQSWLALLFVYADDQGFTLRRLLVLRLLYAWPMVMA